MPPPFSPMNTAPKSSSVDLSVSMILSSGLLIWRSKSWMTFSSTPDLRLSLPRVISTKALAARHCEAEIIAFSGLK
jgi:hypothetical protein